jgi:hypothetical protein
MPSRCRGCTYSLLVRQEIKDGTLLSGQAVREVWRVVPRLFIMKAYFEGAALLWSLIPIYGIIKAVQHRLYWAMASNVLVFEGLSGEAARTRCRDLSRKSSTGIRTLVTVLAFLVTGLLIVWVVGGTFLETIHSFGFWVLIVLTLWVAIPLSGAVNTFLYLAICKDNPCGERNGVILPLSTNDL